MDFHNNRKMDAYQRYLQHADQFFEQLSIKGYRDGFRGQANGVTPEFIGGLDAVLRLMADGLMEIQGKEASLWLCTKIAGTNIHVTLIGQYDPKRGFQVREQHIAHNAQRPDVIRCSSNHEMLSASAILVRMPKPRALYQELLKGRPRRPSG